jgi:hypothetical protein
MAVPADGLRCIASRVDGLDDLIEVAVSPDGIEWHAAGRWVPARFEDIARGPRSA